MKNFTLKGNSIIKGSLLIVMFLLFTTKGFSQYSTKHYIAAAPWDYSSRANEFIISCPSGTASVTITKSDGTAITTMSVTSGSPVAFRPTGNPASKPANAINTIYSDRGLIFTSTLPIAVSVRNIESDAVNGGRPTEIKGNASLASYGNEAIGSSFRVGYYRSDFTGLYAYAPTGFPAATAAPVYSVMAIDNNTVVSINGTVLVTLNAGQCYLFQTAIGSLISSTKPVVMNSGQWRDTPTGCGDSVLNEIPPVRVLGTNYLVVRGSGTTRGTSTNLNFPEQTVFIATEDNTRVTVNTVDTAGTITATNNYLLPTAGSYQSIFHGIDGVKYSASIISADKKIIVYSGTAQSCEVDMACVAPISPCTGSYSVETIKFLKYDNTTNLKYFGYVLVNDASAPVFINGVNLETLTSNSRYQIGSSGYYIMRFTNTQLGDPTNLVFTSSVRMSLSMVQSEGGFSMASYLSSYNDNATQQFAPTINGSGCVSALTAEPGLEPYQWYLNDVLIPGATNQTYVPTETGSYSVAGTKECGLSVASTPVVINCIPIDAVNDGSALNPFATVISGTTLATSVKANDFINGVLVTSTNTSITPKTQVPLTINGAGIISVASGTVNGVYPIEYEICSTSLSPNICDKATAYVKVTVFAGSIAADQTICSGGDPVLFSNTASGVGVGTISYRWESSISPFSAWNIISGATSATYDVPIGLTTTTKYRRVAISTLGDSDPTSSVTITVDPLSVGGTVAGGATVCTGTNSTLLTLSGHIGTIIRWESSLDNFATAGTTIALTSTGITVTNLSATTSYRAILKSGTCTATSSIAIVTVKAKPSSNLSGTATICNGSSTNLSIALTGVQPWNLTYSDGTTPTSVTGITTSPYSISVSPTSIKTYSITALSDANCSGTSFTGTPTVTVNALPTTANAGADQTGATTCGLTTVTLGGNTPTVGTGKWTIVSGTGGSFALDTNPTTTFSGTAGTSYTLRWTISNTPCTASSDDVNVIFNILPIAHAVTGGGAYCSGGTGVVVGLANSQLGVNYQLQLGGVNNGVAVAGTGSAISFGNKTAAGTYTVVATNATTSCTANMTGSVVVTINLLPAAPTAPINVEVCETGSSQTLTATATVPSGSSIVWYDASTGGNVVSPATLVSTTAATRTLYGETSNGTCSSLTRTSVTLTILAAPAAQFATTSDITVACGAVTTSTLSYTNNSTTCPISGSVTSTLSAIPSSCDGSVTESWTFTDELGRIISKSRTITVSPAALPTMTAPAAITVGCGAIPAPSTITFTNGLSGGCEISGTSNASTFSATTNSCGGTVIETWTATDSCGRALASVSRTITIQDTTAPTWSTSANALNITLQCSDATGLATAQSQGPTATDNCGGTVAYTKTSGLFTAGSCANSGTYTNTWIAKDVCDNSSATFTQVITIEDTTAPTFVETLPTDVRVECSAVPTVPILTATDNCGTATVTYTQTTTAGTCVGSYTLTRTWIATDACGLTTTHVQIITVQDTTAPTFVETLPTDVTVECSAVPTAPILTATDNCGTATVTYTETTTAGTCAGSYSLTRTWIAKDLCGLTTTHVQIITVQDTTAPTFVETLPTDVTVECSAVPTAPILTATDNCGTATVTYTETTTAGTCVGSYSLTRTWIAKDLCGLTTTHVQIITVQDTTAPTFVETLPTDVTVECSAVPTAPILTATDNCGTATVAYTQTTTAGTCVGSYTLTRTWIATDACGLTTTHVQTISVQDTTAPTFVEALPANVTVECSAIPTAVVLTATDNCGTATVAYTQTTTAVSCAGSYTLTRTWIATDACGLTTTHVQTISVQDTTAPTFVEALPANVTVECSAIPTAVVLTATDNCGTATVAYTQTTTAGTCVGSYTLTRTWIATDACGLTTTHVQTISVQDTTAPTFVEALPANVTVECSAIPTAVVLTATDNCGTATVAYTETTTAGSCAGSYTLTRTWIATDACGLTTTHVQTISVQDTTAPTFVEALPANVTVECSAIPTAVVLTATDNCGTATVAYTQTTTAGTCAGSYSLTRTWIAKDLCGLTTTHVQTISVQDTTAPTFVEALPANVTVECSAIPTAVVLTATDNCGTATVAYTETTTAGSCAGSYTLTRTWIATDACGLTTTHVQTISVQDTTAPTFVEALPANVTVECSAIPTAVVLTATDNCGTATVAYTETTTAGSCAGSYTLTRTWIATDACGLTTTHVQTISVQDTTAPTFVEALPANVTVECSAIPTAVVLTATDNCGTATVAYTETTTAGTCVGSYTLTRTWIATDACGLTTTHVQTISVQDTTAPTFVEALPANVTVECSAIPTAVVLTATDNCGTATVAYTETTTAGSCAGSYTLTRTWIATDACGLTTTHVQTISVQDTTAPTFVEALPANVTVECSAIPTAVVLTATDNCGTATVAYTETTTAGTCVGSYTLTRTWIATDACGLTTTHVQTISVQDTTAPTFVEALPANVTVECSAIPTAVVLTATDNCGTATVAYTQTTTAGTCVGSYTLTRTWIATDACGLTTTHVQTISVQDTTAPTFVEALPANVTVECSAIPTAVVLTATDNCGTATVAYTQTTTAGSCAGSYTLTRTWIATDACGLTTTHVQTISVQDTTAPTFVEALPANVTVECSAIPTAVVLTATDNCGTATVAYTQTTTAGTCAGSYTLTRTWIATDACGLTTTHVQTISVQDTTAPTFVEALPANVTVECSAIPTAVVLTATDNCGTATVAYTQTTTAGTCVGSYTLTRTWIATDACGLTTTHVQTISVQDTTAPTFVEALPANVTVECSAIPTAVVLTATDNCGTATVAYTQTTTAGTCVGSYTLTRTWIATDACGLTTTHVQTISVQDTTAPTFVETLPTDVTVECSAVPTAPILTATDNCGTATVTYTETTTAGTCAGSYSLTRTWIAKDLCGLTTTHVQIITVQDTTAPTFVEALPANVTVECSAIPTAVVLTATDNCVTATVAYTQTTTAGTCVGSYTLTRTWIATDACGLTTTHVQTISVQDTTAPTFVEALPANVTVECSAIPTAVVLTATDNCGTATVAYTQTTTAGTCVGSYSLTRTWIAKDLCGLTTTHVQIITVQDTTAPTFVETLPTDVTVECSAVPTAPILTATDNCGTATVTYTETTTAGTCAGSYSLTRTWIAKDLCGLTTTHVQIITVQDTTAPTFVETLPTDVTVECSAVPTAPILTATDNCGTATVTYTETTTAGTCVGSYSLTRTWIAKDLCGLTTTHVQIITVQDTTAPTFVETLPTDVTVECSAVPTAPILTATDNCGTATVTYTETTTAGTCAGSYSLTRTWIAKDLCGLTTTHVQTITVQDTTAPTFVETLPTDVTVECSAVPTAPILTATDNCGTATVTYTETTTAGTCAGSYSLTRTWIAKDLCGLTTTHVQTITVQDTKAPVIISCATNQTVASDSNCQALVPDFTKSIVATDNCTAGDSLIVTQLPAVGSIAMSGNTTIIITIEDSCGNKTICEANLLVTNFIVANDDIGSPVNGYTGGISFTNVLSNDLLKCNTIKASDVQISFVNATNPGITFANNNVVVAAGTPAGNYTLTYQICEIANLANCDSAIVTIFVSTPIIDAITETTIPINGLPGGTTASLVGNDNLNGYPVVIGTNPGQVTLREVNVPTGLILNLDGTVTVAPSTPAGNYNVTYTICEVTNPTNCDTVTSIVVVGAAVIQAQNDDIVVDNTLNVVVLKPFNEDHGNGEDTLDGIKITFDKVIVTVTDIILPSGQNFPVPKVDLNSNEIVIPPSVPAGIYTIFYTICEKINPSNCSSAVINITVKNPIVIAEDDLLAPIVSKVGATNAGNVLDANPTNPDTINGKSLNSNLVIISVVTPAIPIGVGSLVPILDTATGFINVPSNTPAGNYSIIYSICDIVNPTICDQATVIIKVIDVDAVNDSLLPIIGAFGGITESVLMNDNMNGVVFTPATFNTVAVTQVGAYPSGITLNADGTLTVAAGTAIGNYTLQYQICSTTLPSICDIADINLTVNDIPSPAPPVIFAADDLSGSLLSSNSVQEVLNVLDNDAVDLAKATLSNVLISTVTADPTGFMTLKSDGTVEMAAFTPSGTYTMTYSICDKLNLNNCDTAIVTVTVGCGLSTAISGLIKNELTNTPLGNVPVTLKPINTTTGPILLSITKADGSYSFTGMVAGDYVIQVQDANLNAAQELYNTTPSFLILKVEDCKYQKIDFGYNKTDLLVLGDFVWYDLNNNGVQDEWYDANNDGLVTKNIPDANGVIDFSKWEWVDFNGDGSYKGIQNAGELNAAGFGNGTTNVPNIFVTGPNGFSRSVTMGVEGYWRTRAPQGAYGEYKIEFIKEANFEQASEAMSASGLVKVLPSGTLKQARTEKSKSYVDCGLTTNTILYAQFTESVKVNLNLDFGISCKTYADILAVNDDAGTVDGTQALTGVLNVLSNDTINGLPAKASDVSITLTPSPNFTIGTDGLLNVLGNTPGGSYSLNYSICEKANPSNCSQATITIVVERPSIALVKTAKFRDENNDGYAQPGETITYSFEITNTGNTPLSNVIISDPLPGVIMSGSPLTLAIGEVSTTHFSGLYFIKQSDINLGSISNQATVYGTAPSGKVVEDKSDELNLVDDNPTVLSVSGCAIEVFNAVSPDGSAGINDKFYVKGLECYPENSIEIFNRWGVLVFEREHYNNEDRAFKGVSEGRVTIEKSSELPVGTYFYILKYRDSANNAFEKSGYLYLNRK
ncbi:gliding motility-associated C-terminal domain-containing protein [Flavobacterium praedii]|uniref:T9SS type B sorting domain-containing protein n=1 Tax=Flavobacterium praedii TaxID=3002900 RepID=UPI002481B260|nr:gliding motility-associated C-terminal domain-containing protein [Flavobacterium praedii]